MEDLKHEGFFTSLKKERLTGSSEVALLCVQFFRKIVNNLKWSTAMELMCLLKSYASKMALNYPSFNELVLNMLYRALKIIRQEVISNYGHVNDDDCESLRHFIKNASLTNNDQINSEWNSFDTESIVNQLLLKHLNDENIVKNAISDSINELVAEIECTRESIVVQALQHLHSCEIVMTAGYSRMVEAFFINAGKTRNFSVIVVELAPDYRGHKMVKKLVDANISTTLIPDSAIWTVMSRVNKVIVGTKCLMPDGSLRAQAGIHAIAVAAKEHSVPFIVCCGLYRLQPHFCSLAFSSTKNNTLNNRCYFEPNINQISSSSTSINAPLGNLRFKSTSAFLSAPQDIFEENDERFSCLTNTQIINYSMDDIPSNLVSLLVTNIGAHAPSYVYRLLSEYYHPDDISNF